MPDLTTPLPDPAHDDLRQAALVASQSIEDHVRQLSDSFLLAQTAAEALAITLDAVTALQAAVADLQAQVATPPDLTALQATVADLTARVTALETAGDTPLPPA